VGRAPTDPVGGFERRLDGAGGKVEALELRCVIIWLGAVFRIGVRRD
jgi:hypothetical protein